MISEVCLFDLRDRSVTCVLRSSRHFEAPNWMPDGTALVLNCGGLLYRLSLETGETFPIDTGFARNLNNDHGISPNGTQLAISDSTETGQSMIYTLPISGGAPVQVTSHAPCYWHGWSPDGATIVFVGKRNGVFDVYSCAASGGSELRLTSDFAHCDGPEYTPDGQWIWFNGERVGAVNLWRMRPDGSDLERMTDDELVNWFPHPSPDGRTVLFLAYPSGMQGHPANKTVELRVMPSGGGRPETLVSLNGGQGTINVPCWAPDSTRFAFVRYSESGSSS